MFLLIFINFFLCNICNHFIYVPTVDPGNLPEVTSLYLILEPVTCIKILIPFPLGIVDIIPSYFLAAFLQTYFSPSGPKCPAYLVCSSPVMPDGI